MGKQYERPSLEKIGTVEEVTGALSLSGGDGSSQDPSA
jgi:hypothetical protein